MDGCVDAGVCRLLVGLGRNALGVRCARQREMQKMPLEPAVDMGVPSPGQGYR
jgi:hypothetical protein